MTRIFALLALVCSAPITFLQAAEPELLAPRDDQRVQPVATKLGTSRSAGRLKQQVHPRDFPKDFKHQAKWGEAVLPWIQLSLLPWTQVSIVADTSRPSSGEEGDSRWLQERGTPIFYDTFDREEDGNLAKAIGNGWNSATADRVPHLKMADLDDGILKIASASKEAGHSAHIHHEAGFEDGGVSLRFKFPGINKSESLQLGFVDRETKGIHAGHLCYALLGSGSVTLMDWKTGVMNLQIRSRRQPYLDRKEPLPADLDSLLKTKQLTVSCKIDNQWHKLVLVTQGDEMRLSMDGSLVARHRSDGFAHPTKRWFSLLVPSTVWIDDVTIWKVK